MTASRVAEQWQAIQREAHQAHAQHSAQLKAHRDELERVMAFFGARRAMEFAWSELGIPSLAFLLEFDLMEQGEAFGLFAL